jgi:hypothetical protein
MIGQYLSNNNEKRYSVILPKILDLNRPLVYTVVCRVHVPDRRLSRFDWSTLVLCNNNPNPEEQAIERRFSYGLFGCFG